MRSPGTRRSCTLLAGALALPVALALVAAGCLRDGSGATGGNDLGVAKPDFCWCFPEFDLASNDDLVVVWPPDPCGESPPSPWCESWSWDPGSGLAPLPMPGDPRDPNLTVDPVPQGVRRDGDGSIVLDKVGSGSYALIFPGCVDRGSGAPYDAQWWSIDWKADVPAGADLAVRARSSSVSDWQSPLWNSATPTPWHKQPKIDLVTELKPNQDPQDPSTIVNDQYLRVDVTLTASPNDTSPRLRSMVVAWKCHDSLGGLRQRDRQSAAFRASTAPRSRR